ncbi:hypothetical protein [Enterovibrio norvegicus]|uniref:hypothetical protein n=1 Tax=Enterovibrio norvegicus TaxID=188144 RepID=UPI0003075C0E|nr:hypothetical protein [Enterovibrio norvegicus]OEF57935.1 hypothetical protein A1OU_06930 [Enterovibrio norvegicus]
MDNFHRVFTELVGQGSNLSVPSILVRFFNGQYNTAAVMSQLVFWSGKTKRTDGWFYKSQNEIADELYLSRDQVKREIRKIKSAFSGAVSTKIVKASGAPTTHFYIDFDALIDTLSLVCAESPNGLGDNAQSNGRNRPIHGSGDSAQSITDPIHIHTTDPIDPTHNVDTPLSVDTEPAIFQLQLKGGASSPVTQSDIDTLSKTYPNIDVRAEIAKAADWLASNPTRRKTPRGIKRFITGWLSRSSERIGRPMSMSQQARIEAQNASAVQEWLDSRERNVYEHAG